jgi:hypothetical protein
MAHTGDITTRARLPGLRVVLGRPPKTAIDSKALGEYNTLTVRS